MFVIHYGYFVVYLHHALTMTLTGFPLPFAPSKNRNGIFHANHSAPAKPFTKPKAPFFRDGALLLGDSKGSTNPKAPLKDSFLQITNALDSQSSP